MVIDSAKNTLCLAWPQVYIGKTIENVPHAGFKLIIDYPECLSIYSLLFLSDGTLEQSVEERDTVAPSHEQLHRHRMVTVLPW